MEILRAPRIGAAPGTLKPQVGQSRLRPGVKEKMETRDVLAIIYGRTLWRVVFLITCPCRKRRSVNCAGKPQGIVVPPRLLSRLKVLYILSTKAPTLRLSLYPLVANRSVCVISSARLILPRACSVAPPRLSYSRVYNPVSLDQTLFHIQSKLLGATPASECGRTSGLFGPWVLYLKC